MYRTNYEKCVSQNLLPTTPNECPIPICLYLLYNVLAEGCLPCQQLIKFPLYNTSFWLTGSNSKKKYKNLRHMPSAHLGEVDWKNTIQRKMGITISINPVTQSQPIQINCKIGFFNGDKLQYQIGFFK